MDVLHLLCCPPAWLTTPVLILVTLYLYTTYKQSFFKRLGIPGPKPRPFLGILPDFARQGTFHTDIELVRKYGKCFGVYVGNAPSLMVSDPDMIQEILVKQFSCFTNRSKIVQPPDSWRLSLISSVGDHWRYMRNIISPTFSTNKLRAMDPIIHRCLNNFINNLKEQLQITDVVEMQKLFVALTMDVISGIGFGIDIDAQREPDNRFAQEARKMMDAEMVKSPLSVLNFIFPELQGVCAKLGLNNINDSGECTRNTIKMSIEERRNRETSKFNDILNLMLKSQKDDNKGGKTETRSSKTEARSGVEADDAGTGKKINEAKSGKNGDNQQRLREMTDDEVLWNAIVFFMVGHDTTASTLAWMVYLLATHQDVQERLIAEIDQEVGSHKPEYDTVEKLPYLDMVLSETLRLYSPAPRTNRETTHDTVVCGVKIPKGTDITFPFHGLHRLPEFWPDPEKFDPERFSKGNRVNIKPYSYIPFGLGPRNCIGMRLAKIEVKMAAVALLQHFRLYPSEKLEDPLAVSKGSIVKPAHGVWLRIERRQ